MTELTMFERLLQLPLFQGLTVQDISEVMSHVRLNFTNYHAGDEIVMQDDHCRNLIYIISGEVTAEYHDPDRRFTLMETLPDTKVLEPYNMFGMRQKFSRSYLFATDGITLTIEKPVMIKQLLVNDIIKINLLNISCNKYQQTLHTLRELPDNTVKEKIVRFILSYSTTPKGEKKIFIKMQELADIIHETRLNVSTALNAMKEEGLITPIQRGKSTTDNIRGGFGVKNLQDLYR